MNKRLITGREVFMQLLADLIGKDSYRGVTLTYAWLANQFGHFSLGFIFTLLIYPFLKIKNTVRHPELASALIVSAFWLLFELYNFLGPILSRKLSALSGRRYIFQPAWRNIAFDTVTDVAFCTLGSFFTALILLYLFDAGSASAVLITLAAIALLLIYPCRYWFLTKMYLQAARYPFQFRLSHWNAIIDKDGEMTVSEFLSHEKDGKHLLLFGGRGSGKTSLSIGLATELSIRHRACLYITGIKLYHLFFENYPVSCKEPLWTWRSSSLMIIDDINPCSPVPDDLITPEKFLSMLDAGSASHPENRRTLKEKNIIWVLGRKEGTAAWRCMLEKIGVAPENISTVCLSNDN